MFIFLCLIYFLIIIFTSYLFFFFVFLFFLIFFFYYYYNYYYFVTFSIMKQKVLMARKLLHISLLILASTFCIIGSAQQDTIITDTVTKEVLIPLRKRVADEIKTNLA